MLDWTSLIFLGFVAVVFYFLISQKKALTELYQQQAAKRNGQVKRFLLIFPKLILYDQGTQILINQTSGGKNSPPVTSLECTLNSMADYSISIGPEHVFTRIGKGFGMQDILIGNPEFDESFLIQGSDEGTVRAFLAPEIQERVLRLAEKSPIIKIQKKAFSFRVSGRLRTERQLDQFIEAGLELIKKANEIGF
jgi:hypothetical protein